MKSELRLPRHVAFIMDGNGRWAAKRLMPRSYGHSEGVKTMKRTVDTAIGMGVRCLSFYAFSTENWSRPADEVDSLTGLIKKNLVSIGRELREKNVKMRFMGSIAGFDSEVKDVVMQAEALTDGCDGGVVNIGLGYGARAEIVTACNKAVRAGKPVTESEFERLLYTDGLPDPDLVVRTGGEKRLSNFMLYQAAYAELIFTDKLWPDLKAEDIREFFEEYSRRSRRFGKI